MAIVSTGFELVVNLVDNSGFGTTRRYALTAATAAAAATDTTAILAALDAVSDALITGYSLSQRFADDANPALPAMGVQVENQAILILGLTDFVSKRATVSIPAPVAAIWQAPAGPGADIVDDANALIQTYVGLFAPGAEATLSDGETADGIIRGHRRHVASAEH